MLADPVGVVIEPVANFFGICSGLTKAAYAAAGITLPRAADSQFRAGPQLAPGVDALDALLDLACRTLHLPTIRDRDDEIAAAALRQQASYKTFLLELLEAECDHRDERRRLRIVRDARFPRPKRIEDFDYSAYREPHR